MNVNLLSSTPASQEEMASVPVLSAKVSGSPTGRSSARLKGTSGRSLIEQRRMAGKAASSKLVVIDLTTAPSVGSKRKVSARSDGAKEEGVLKKKNAAAVETAKPLVDGTSIASLLQVQDPILRLEYEGSSPSDCIGEAGVATWKALQCLLGAYSGVQAMVAKAEDRAARTESDLAALRTKLKGAESRCQDAERRLVKERETHEEELAACRRELEESRAGVEEKIAQVRTADGHIAGDVGAYYAVKSRIEMIEEFGEGKHEQWDLEAEKESLRTMYPDGEPGLELLRLAGIGEEVAGDAVEEDDGHSDDLKLTAAATSPDPAPADDDAAAPDV